MARFIRLRASQNPHETHLYPSLSSKYRWYKQLQMLNAPQVFSSSLKTNDSLRTSDVYLVYAGRDI